MAAHTHAVFDEQGKFLGWVSYISGGYECDALDWHGETVSDVEKFLDSVQAVPFDDLTDENWAAIRSVQSVRSSGGGDQATAVTQAAPVGDPAQMP